ncbi:MAG: 2-keto-3-deoxygluconate permease [Negativibacillus sp.]|nr:2-keto-3-deoxygluconate permease [Negativibacillus sp.]
MTAKKNVNIWKSLQKVPAGTMFVPLIIGAIITTVCQGFFQFDLWGTLGNPMKDMFSSSGQMLIIGLMLFCTGTQLKISDMKDALHRGVLLILVRLGIAYLLCALFYMAFVYDGIFGISFLAFVCAVTSANAALYMGIISPFGDKADKASFGIMLICSMPLLPLLFLGFYGTSGFGDAQVMQIISLIIPFILGMVLGNLDEDIRKVFAGGNAIILPFLGFEFGSTINLINAFKMIPQGLLLSIVYFIIVITPSYLFERTVLHRPGYASVASGSLAGVALVIPSMAATSNAAFEPYVTSAVAVLAFVLAVTNILCPFMVKFILTKHPADEQPKVSSNTPSTAVK